MNENQQRMNIKGFIYLTIIFIVFLMVISTFFLILGANKAATIHNKELVIIFSILDVAFLIGII